jgi:hypothetical protein
VNKEVNPRAVFDRLFGSPSEREARQGMARREALRKSILDFVSDDAKRLQSTLGRNDQRKLDEYLTGVREIERRLERTEKNADGPKVLDEHRPAGVPREYAEHLRLMADMMVLAFQTDSTRIATFMFTNAGSNRNYRDEIGVRDGHHDLSHHGGDPTKLDKIKQINRFHVQQYTYLLERLKSVREGDGTLLDNCMVVYGSGLSDGNRHNNENLPVLLAGRGGGTIDTGRHVRYKEETPMCNLFTSMLDRVGVRTPYFGDSTGRLRGLQV